MKKRILCATAALFCMIAFTAAADQSYIGFDAEGNMLISGPFNAIVPRPDGMSFDGPVNYRPSILDEELTVSIAGYYADDLLLIAQVETTDTALGTVSKQNLPTVEIAGREHKARKFCLNFSQDEMENSGDPLIEFIARQNVQVIPAMIVWQLLDISEDGTGSGQLLLMRHLPDGCDAMTSEFKVDFDNEFEQLLASIFDAE